jgi:hypothetical protein
MSTPTRFKALLLPLLFLLTFSSAFAQVGIGTTTPNANSVLELNSTNKGLLIPRMTTVQRVTFGLTLGAADEGMVVMDTDLNTLLLWNGSSFTSPSRDWRTTGNNNVSIGDYLGTTDNADLSIRTNGIERIGINGTTGFVSLSTAAGGGDRLLTVDNAGRIIASSAVATNGLTQIGNTLRLGGSLLFSTTLSSGGFNFTFDGPGNLLMTTGARLGIGVSGFPGSALSVGGATGDFRVNSNGTILAATGITSSGTITFSGLGGGGTRVVTTDNTGLLGAAALIGESTTANNGLTLTGANVTLGGNLTGSTTLGLGSSNLLFTRTTGNIGIGASAPLSLLSVGGTAGNFQVLSSGVIAAAAGITSSGPITLSGLGGGGNRVVGVDNAGLLSGVVAAIMPFGTVNNNTLRWNGAWVESNTLVNTGTNIGIGLSGLPAAPLSVGGTTGNFRVTAAGGMSSTSITNSGSTILSVLGGGGNRLVTVDNTGLLSAVAATPIANGIGTNNTLRWNGSAWVESNNLTNDADGIGIGSSPIPGNKLWVSYFGVTTPGSSGIASIINSTATSGSARALNADVTHTNGGDGEGISLNVSGNSGSGSSWGIFSNVQGAATGSKTAFQSNVSGAGEQYVLLGSLSADAATTGQTGSLLSLSTNGNNVSQTGLSLNLMGASTSSKTGINLNVFDATGGTTTGLNVNVSGGAVRNAANFTGGNVGISLDPTQIFNVGGFVVNHTGAISSASGITSSGNINFSSLGGGGSRVVTVDNLGLLSAVPLSTLPANNANSILFNDGAAWLASATSGSGAFNYDGTSVGIGTFVNPSTKINVNYAAGATPGATGQSLTLTSTAAAGNANGYYSDVTHTSTGGANGIYSRVEGNGGTGGSGAFFAFTTGTSTGNKSAYDASVLGSGGQNGFTASLQGSAGTTSQTGASLLLETNGNNFLQKGIALDLTGVSNFQKTGLEINLSGGTNINRGLLVSVTGGTNVAAAFLGNVGIGNNAPNNQFTVGATNQFQVNSSGAIAAATGITSSGATTLSALGGGGTRIVSVDNTGLLSAVTGSVLPANSTNSLLFNNGTSWQASAISGSNAFVHNGTGTAFGTTVNANNKVTIANVTSTPSQNALAATLNTSATTGGSSAISTIITNSSDGIAVGQNINATASAGVGTLYGVFMNMNGAGTGSKIGSSVSITGTGSHTGYATSLTADATTASQLGQNLFLTTSGNNVNQTGVSMTLTGVSTGNKTGVNINLNGATAGTTNGLSVSVSGGASTYAATFFGGNVGIGNTAPTNLFTVGSTNQFQVNTGGAIAAATGITSSGAITLSGLGGGGTRMVAVDNAGLLSAVAGSTIANGTSTNNTLYWSGSAWVESSALLNNGTNIGIGVVPNATTRVNVNYPAGATPSPFGVASSVVTSAATGIANAFIASMTASGAGTSNGVRSVVSSSSTGPLNAYDAFFSGSGTGNQTAFNGSVNGTGTGAKRGVYIDMPGGTGANTAFSTFINGNTGQTSQSGLDVNLASGNINLTQIGANLLLSGASTGNKTAITATVNGGTNNTNTGLSLNVSGGVMSTNRGLDVSVSGGVTQYAATFTGGNVGIGTTTPTRLLHVAGSAATDASIFGSNSGTTGTGVEGVHTGTSNGIGVKGTTTSSSGYGVWGGSSGSAGVGVWAEHTGTGAGYGVYASTTSASNGAVAIYATATAPAIAALFDGQTTLNGGIVNKVTFTTTPLTLDQTHSYVVINASVNVTLPLANLNIGRTYFIMRGPLPTGASIVPNGADRINGGALGVPLAISANYKVCMAVAISSGRWIVTELP